MTDDRDTEAPRPSVAQVATRGLAWMTLASVAAKVVGFAQLIVLAWFLKVEDFGLLTMAGTVVAFATIPLRFGLEEILVQRYRRFHLWSGPAFWLSVSAGAGTMLLLLAAAPFGAWFYGSWRVAALMAVMAAVTPVTAAMAVPFAKLSAELRFRALAMLAVVQIATQTLVAVPLAWLGAGAMSVAIASLAAAIVTTLGHWRLSGLGVPRPGRDGLGARRWRYFARDSAMLQGNRLAIAVASNVDFVVIGRLGGAAPLGLYSYAYNQSLQTMRLVAANAAGVLFPSLSSFGDDADRKYAAFLRGMRLVAPLLVPFCLLQAALADPAFRLCFKPEYWPVVPLFQILSVSAVGVGAVTLCQSFMLSLRRNDLNLACSTGSAACFCALVPIGYAAADIAGVAWAVATTSLLSLAFAHRLCARAVRRPLAPALRVYARPILLGAASCAPAWAIVTLAMPPERGHAAWARLTIGLLAFAVAYPPLLWMLSRETFAELARRVRSR